MQQFDVNGRPESSPQDEEAPPERAIPGEAKKRDVLGDQANVPPGNGEVNTSAKDLVEARCVLGLSADDLFHAAQEWYARGYNVVPNKRPDEDGLIKKRPAVCWKKWQNERIPESTLRGWRRRFAHGLGFITGNISGVVVIEADGPIGKALLDEFGLPRTLTILSGSGRGPHYHFKHPGSRVTTKSNAAIQIDVKGDGGFAMLPPSRHKSGGRYKILDDAPVADLPSGLLEFIEEKATAAKAAASSDETEVNCFEAVGVAQTRANVDQRLQDMRFQGEGSAGVNETQLYAVRALLWHGVGIDEAVEKIVEATRRVAPESWDWKAEEKKVRDLCKVWDAKKKAEAAQREKKLTGSIVFEGADSIVMEPVDWLWKGYLARKKLHILGGAPDAGKSTICFSFAATVSSGGVWPDGTRAKAGNVLIWSGEDDAADTIVPRLTAMGADLSRIKIIRQRRVSDYKARPFNPALDMPALTQAALVFPDSVAMLILDPVVSVIGSKTDSHNNAETRNSLAPVLDLAEAVGCAVVGVHHFTKGTSGRDPVERISGSLAFGAVARIVLVAAKNLSDMWPPRVFTRAKSNIGPSDGGFGYDIKVNLLPKFIEATSIEWGEEVEGTAKELLDEAEKATPRETKLDEAKELLRDLLAKGEAPRDDIEAHMGDYGISERTLTRAKKALGVASRSGGFGKEKKYYWSLAKKEK